MPILVAGDLLHKWSEPAELVNFAIGAMPHVFAVAGNHDLPSHSLHQIKRSAYWTLIESGKVTDLYGKHTRLKGMNVYGFPCGVEVTGPIDGLRGLNLAVIHAYCYDKDKHPGAKPEEHWTQWAKRCEGYDVMHTGDNHQPVHHHWQNRTLYNAGAFVRRRSDERQLKPRVGVLHSDGSVVEHLLDVSGDEWVEGLDDGQADAAGVDATEFVNALHEIGSAGVDFTEAVKAYVRKHRHELTRESRRLLTRILEECRE